MSKRTSHRGQVATPLRLVLTCEHGGNAIPAHLRSCFETEDARDALASHRGWDPGALLVAQALKRRFEVSLVSSTVSRLVVDLNRSERNPSVLSDFTRPLPPAERERLLQRYHRPHWARVRDRVDAVVRDGGRVLHLAVHSFTPVLQGEARNADVAVLYDPTREPERHFAVAFREKVKREAPELRVRRNYPYRGAADGLSTALRRDFSPDDYVGIELELSQAELISATKRRHVVEVVTDGLRAFLADETPPRRSAPPKVR